MKNRKRIVVVNQKVEDEPKLRFRARIPRYGGMPARGPEERCGCMDAFHHWQSGMQPACRNTWSYWDQGWVYYHHKVAPRPRHGGGGGVQQIVYKPCRVPAFCRGINIPPPTSRINNDNGHGYRRRYGFYRFVSPEHRREFLEWFNRSYDARLEPLIRSSERG